MGPFPGLPDSIALICVGTLFVGIAGAFTNNNAVPAMDGLSKSLGIADEDKSELKNIISSINTGAFGFGSIVGPIFASIFSSLFSNDGYRGSYAIVLFFVIAVAGL
jgi:MFS family permease